ncbi:MAG TPA: hypothetical protein DDW85_07850 [Porphyromonadaceae bacterium]|jgi:hypothetical protein|nr:hypothetical protein [Porphyromonadaceae bacterium]
MHGKIIFFISLFLYFVGMNLFSIPSLGSDITDRDTEIIELKQQEKPSRSATTTEVKAYIEDWKDLNVEIINYTGQVAVHVYGSNNTQYTMFTSYDNGFGTLDISSLPEGSYTVYITLENTIYQGFFERGTH